LCTLNAFISLLVFSPNLRICFSLCSNCRSRCDVQQFFLRQLFWFSSTIEEWVVFRLCFRTCHVHVFPQKRDLLVVELNQFWIVKEHPVERSTCSCNCYNTFIPVLMIWQKKWNACLRTCCCLFWNSKATLTFVPAFLHCSKPLNPFQTFFRRKRRRIPSCTKKKGKARRDRLNMQSRKKITRGRWKLVWESIYFGWTSNEHLLSRTFSHVLLNHCQCLA
jgi:hypothetical protein